MNRFAAGVLLCLLLCGCDQTPFQSKGRFQMVGIPLSPNHEDKVWVLDTATGSLRLCYEMNAAVKCLSPTARLDQ